MRVFDLHCDTAGECYKKNKSLYDNDMHLSLKRAAEYEEYDQVFAVWIPDELRGKAAVEYFDGVADFFYKTIQAHSDTVSLFSHNKKTPVRAVLSVEGASACGGTADGIYHLFDRGVRLATLTWNGQNEIASGAFADGGFTDFGKEFVSVADELGIILDVSHLNQQGFKELAQMYSKPFIASHSNGDIVDNYYAHKRNLADWQIDVIRDRGGLIGLNFCSDFIDDVSHQGTASLAHQIKYLSSKGCDDVIALGSDFDGCEMHPELSGVEKLERVYADLLDSGITETLLNKVFYSNAKRFFDEYLK